MNNIIAWDLLLGFLTIRLNVAAEIGAGSISGNPRSVHGERGRKILMSNRALSAEESLRTMESCVQSSGDSET